MDQTKNEDEGEEKNQEKEDNLGSEISEKNGSIPQPSDEVVAAEETVKE